MIKAMIIDDEKSSIDLLSWLINEYCTEISEIRSSVSVKDAIPVIDVFQPDILFLDIQMPKQSGFDLLTTLENWNFEVIFTTAFNEYAIQAIRFSAFDYLLKPIDEKELREAVVRFMTKRSDTKDTSHQFKNFVQNILQEDKKNFKLALAGHGEIKYVNLSDIIHLQAESNYTRIFLANNKVFFSAKTLKEYDEILIGHNFLRVHRSHLVNPTHITSYERQGIIHLVDGSLIEVSRRKKEYFQKSLGSMR